MLGLPKTSRRPGSGVLPDRCDPDPRTDDSRHNPASLSRPDMSPSGAKANPLLIEAQTDMLSAQAQAVAVQGLPSLKRFSGENVDSEDDSFDKWLEVFEERALLAVWAAQHKLYQLKMHLERTALQIFRMMPEDSKKIYSMALEHLKKRFKQKN